MSVTINEFEVVPDSAPAAQTAVSYGAEYEMEKLSLEELNALLRREMERQARVWAH